MNRALSLSSKATRELESVADDVIAGRMQKALERLAVMLGWRAVPELKRQKRDELASAQLTIERLQRELRHAKLFPPVATEEIPNVGKTVRMQPKPQRRIEDRNSIAAFKTHNDRCAIRGCDETDADPHHIVPRSHARSSDDERNLLNLGRRHHDEWHRIGREAFYAKYAGRLCPLDQKKILLAAELEIVAKLAEREVIDLDKEGM